MSRRRSGPFPLVVAFALLGVGVVLIEVGLGPQLLLAALGVAAFAGYVLIAVFRLLSPPRLSDAGPSWIPAEADRESTVRADRES